jgi:hypothetical protein
MDSIEFAHFPHVVDQMVTEMTATPQANSTHMSFALKSNRD